VQKSRFLHNPAGPGALRSIVGTLRSFSSAFRALRRHSRALRRGQQT
ncbi:hypothetical protein A2U01_0104438, partial [Trifolium medium]|nr:hypothetical protein [Trifolium medium]